MALYFYFNETVGDLVYSNQATYDVEGYTSLGEQTNTAPTLLTDWIFDSKRASIKTVTKDPAISSQIDVLTSMWSMFGDCSILTSLDLSGFDTSNVTDMNYMFSNCLALKSLDLSSFNTSNVTDMGNMFYGCLTLTSLDLSNFDTSNVTNMSGMFSNCQTLRIIDISPNMSNVLDQLPAATYYDAVTRQSYAKADIPGGSTYVRDLADLDLVATMVQTRMGINKVKDKLNEQAREIQSLRDSVSRIAVRQVSTPSKSVPGGGFATYSADASTDEGTPIGIVGLTSNHPASLCILSFNLSGGTAWAQVRSVSSSDMDIAIRFYVLYV